MRKAIYGASPAPRAASLRPPGTTCSAWVAVAVFLASPPACAGERQDLSGGWPAGWARIGPVEGTVIGGLVISDLLLRLLKTPDPPRWDSPILFDGAVRDALRASSPQGRSRAATASDFGYFGLALYPVVVDAGLVTWLGRGKPDAALQIALIQVEALAVEGILITLMQRATARARPFASGCSANPRPDCTVPAEDRNTAFVSGHATVSFTAASVLCMLHSRLAVYGSGEAAVCPAALAIAATTSVLRIVADRHWATDVLGGAALGSAVGTLVSWAHLRGDAAPPGLGLSLLEGGRAISYGGRF